MTCQDITIRKWIGYTCPKEIKIGIQILVGQVFFQDVWV